ncbi:hypothetical protein MJM99_30435, partial [Salmonella enterica subsp. enterica serovar Kentucky]|nr:hypothetical protein [Salmonella enterica subsp. enterica serovar Kentucky]
MQHELVERARESGALTKADITKAWFIYWLGAEVSSSYERLQSQIPMLYAGWRIFIASSRRKSRRVYRFSFRQPAAQYRRYRTQSG